MLTSLQWEHDKTLFPKPIKKVKTQFWKYQILKFKVQNFK